MKKVFIATLLGAGVLTAAPVMAAPTSADGKAIHEVMTKDLPDLPGKEGVVITVTYAPGSNDEVHRHDAHSFLYVLEGSVVMQVKGGQPVTLKAGQGFYEGPTDIHVVGRNASKTKPAKFVVFLVKNKNAPLVLPAQ